MKVLLLTLAVLLAVLLASIAGASSIDLLGMVA